MKFLPFLLILTLGCFSQESFDSTYISHSMENDPFLQLLKGKKFHQFSVKNASGGYISSKKIKGKITLINFWFEACAPCISEFKSLNALYEKYKPNKDFKFISFSFEHGTTISNVIKKYNLSFPIYHLSRDSCKLLTFNIQGYPSNYILDDTGKVEFVGIGGPLDADKVETLFKYVYEAYLNRLLNK